MGRTKTNNTNDAANQTPATADLAVERALLGCLMLDADLAFEACATANPPLAITADLFTESPHKRLFATIKATFDAGEPIDHYTVGDDPEMRLLALDAIKTEAAPVSPIMAASYTRRLRDLADRRRLLDTLNRAAELAYAGDTAQAAALMAGVDAPMAERRQQTSWTAAELLAAEFPDPVWLAPDLIPTGLVVLAGRPKLGKSWMGLQLAIAVATGGRFLDVQVEQRPVAYVALEDTPRRLQNRLKKMQMPASAKLHLVTAFPGLETPDTLATLERWRRDAGVRLIIIDTLTRALGAVDQNDNVTIGVIVAQLQRWAVSNDVCLLIVDHHRKAGAQADDLVSDIMGATSKPGAADALMGLYRQRGQTDATLKTTGRDIEERELAVKFDQVTGCWQLLGDREEVLQGEQQQAIVNSLKMLVAATAREIAEATGAQTNHCYERLTALVERGVVKVIEGTSPTRFTLAKK